VYLYPLFLAFALIPLTAIPYWLANFLWFGLSLASLVLGCLLLLDMAENEKHAATGWQLAVPGCAIFVLLFSPIQNNLLNGQVNLIVMLCCVLFIRYFSQKRPILSAVWLGAAIAIKLTPAFLLLFVLVRREYRVLLWTVLFTIFFCLLPGIVVGRSLVTFYKGYWDNFLLPSLMGIGPKTMFFGLRGTIEYFIPAIGSSTWTRGLSLLTTIAVVLAVDIRGRRLPPAQRDAWTFCAYMLGCLLISPAAEVHHLVFAIPAAFLLGMKAFFDRRWATKTVLLWMGCFVVCFDLGAKMYGDTPLYFVSLVILMILVFLAIRPSREISSPLSAALPAGP
jgi:alpha-1,2-mannosyltransferase